MADGSAIITFDVGGKILKTSRMVINQYPESMLARLVSDTWHVDSDQPVFIDRDGDIFAQVLNYLRYRSITLPLTVSKEMFLRDMEYYGIVVEDGDIREDLDKMQVKFHAQTSAHMDGLERKLIAQVQSSLGVVEERITSFQSDVDHKFQKIHLGNSRRVLRPERYNIKALHDELKNRTL